MLVLHYTGMRTAAEAIARLRDPVAQVSSHYVVDEDGTILRLVPEEWRAWHAGVSHWRGHSALNERSIGIEIVNPGHEWGYRPFPAVQMEAVRDLCLSILLRHDIPARNVVAHSDVAPDRKQDPGELFDWRGLAEAGIGIWPDGVADDDTGRVMCDAASAQAVTAALCRIGYRVSSEPELACVVRAFQRHWRPEAVTGQVDKGTLERLEGVLRLLRGG